MSEKFCFHDYVTVESMTTKEAAKQIAHGLVIGGLVTRSEVLMRFTGADNKMVYDRACLKCKKCITDLTNFRKLMKSITVEDIAQVEEELRKEHEEAAKKAANTRERLFTARKIFREQTEG